MTKEQKNNLVIQVKQANLGKRQDLVNSFPSIYNVENVQRVLFDFMCEVCELIQTIEETPTQVSEQTYTLKEISEAIENLDFDNSDLTTLDVNEYGNECKIESSINEHEMSDFLQTEIIEFLNNLEK